MAVLMTLAEPQTVKMDIKYSRVQIFPERIQAICGRVIVYSENERGTLIYITGNDLTGLAYNYYP